MASRFWTSAIPLTTKKSNLLIPIIPYISQTAYIFQSCFRTYSCNCIFLQYKRPNPSSPIAINESDLLQLQKIIYYPSISLIRLTISIAPSAHSNPLLPAFVPARSIACSIVSVVSTPNITGISLAKETFAMPLETSLHT